MVLLGHAAVLAAFMAFPFTSVSMSPYSDISIPGYLNFISCCTLLHRSGVLDVVMALVFVTDILILNVFAVVWNWSSLCNLSSLSAISTAWSAYHSVLIFLPLFYTLFII